MAIQWGGFSGHMRVGIDVRHDGYDTNTPSINVYVDFYVQCDSSWNFGDSQRLNISGNVGGGWDFYNDMGPNAVKFIGTAIVYNQSQSYGGGPTYWFHGQIAGHYQGATPAQGINWTLPARPANVPTNPPTWVSEVTSNSARINVSASDGRGAGVDAYETAVSLGGANWGGWHQSWGGGSGYATNLAPATTYEGAARAHNWVGWSGWSYTGHFTTGATVPTTPGTGSTSEVAQTSARYTWLAPASNGGSAITSYGIQISRNSGFTDVVQDFETSNTALTRLLENLVPGQQYWVRSRARNGVGWSGYNNSSTFTTLAGTPSIIAPTAGSTQTNAIIDVTLSALGIASDRTITLQVSKDSTFATGIKTVTLATTAGASANNQYRMLDAAQYLDNGTYYARARVTNNTSGYVTPWSEVVSYTQSHTPTASLQSPIAGQTLKYAATTQFSWQFIDAASPNDVQSAYRLVVEDNATGATIYDSGKTTLASAAGANTVTVSVALATSVKNVTLRWRVMVWDLGDQASVWTNYNILRLSDPPVVGITFPTSGLPVNTGNPTFTWTASVPSGMGIATTEVIVREQTTNNIVWQTTLTGSTLSATPDTTILLNLVGYSVYVKVTDTVGLTGEASLLFTTQYIAPDPVIYTVDAAQINSLGYVNVDWSQQQGDTRLIAWRVYRRELPSNEWVQIAEIPDEAVRTWSDFLVKSGHNYMYTVTQLADRSGAILESPLGSRGITVTIPTVTNHVVNPRGVAPSTTAVERRKNWARNPSAVGTNGTGVDQSADLQGVGGSPAAQTLTYSTDRAHHGTTSFKAAITGTGQFGRKIVTPGLSMAVGDTIRWSFWIYSTKAGTIQPYWEGSKTSDGTYTGGGGTTVTVPANTWTKVEGAWIGSTIAANVGGVGAYNLSVVAGDTVYLDEFLVEKNAPFGDYFDGSTTDTETQDFAWTGTANASPSIMSSSYVEVRRNLAPNPSAVGGNPGWNQWHGSGAGSAAHLSNGGAVGDNYYRMTWTTANTDVSGGAYVDGGRVVAGTAYTASMWIRPSITQVMRLSMEWNAGAVSYGPPITCPANVWTRINTVLGAVAPAGATSVFVTAYAYPVTGVIWPVGAICDFDGLLMEAAAVVRDYFDGSTADADPYVYEWWGAANASISTQRSQNPASFETVGINGKTVRALASKEGIPAPPTGDVVLRSVVDAIAASGNVSIVRPVAITGLTVGQTYTASMWVYAPYDTWISLVNIGWGNRVTAGSWQLTRQVFTATATSHSFHLMNYSSASIIPAGVIYTTAFMLTEGNYLGQYFDGAMQQTPDTRLGTRWTGLANASKSELYEIPFRAESQIDYLEIERYWLIVEDHPEHSVMLSGVTSASESVEYEDETFTLIGRGRHTDYGDRLGASGSLTTQIRQPERESVLRKKIEYLRDLRENYWLRTPFGRLYRVSLGNLDWEPLAGTGTMEMGDLTIPWQEVA